MKGILSELKGSPVHIVALGGLRQVRQLGCQLTSRPGARPVEGNNWRPSQPSLEASWASGPDLPIWNMTSLICSFVVTQI